MLLEVVADSRRTQFNGQPMQVRFAKNAENLVDTSA